jgi:hypothetical protein
MTAAFPGPAAPDDLAAALAPDLVAVIGYPTAPEPPAAAPPSPSRSPARVPPPARRAPGRSMPSPGRRHHGHDPAGDRRAAAGADRRPAR